MKSKLKSFEKLSSSSIPMAQERSVTSNDFFRSVPNPNLIHTLNLPCLCRELGTVIRSLGQRPSEDELTEIIAGADKDGNGEIDFPEFLQLMAKKMTTGDPDGEIKDAWAVFSMGEEFIPFHQLERIMVNLGTEDCYEANCGDELDDLF